MRRHILLIPLVATAMLPASADPLLDQARAPGQADGPLYIYEMEYSDGDVQATGKVDPSQPEGSRITVYTPEESAQSEAFREALKSLEADVDGDIFCDDLAAQIPDGARRTGETAETASYAFTPKPDADADNMERKMMKRIDASAVLSKRDGQLLAFSMSLPKPFKPAMVAKIETFQLDISCARAPDGRTYLEDMQMQVSGSALMQGFEETVSRRITRLLEPVPLP